MDKLKHKINFLKNLRPRINKFDEGGELPKKTNDNMFVSFNPTANSVLGFLREKNKNLMQNNLGDDDFIKKSLSDVDLFYNRDFETGIGKEIAARKQGLVEEEKEDIVEGEENKFSPLGPRKEIKTQEIIEDKKEEIKTTPINLDDYKGKDREEFEAALEEVAKIDPRLTDDKKRFFRLLAAKESSFRKGISAVTNKHHGYFQLSNTNIKNLSEAKTVKEYLNSPTLQIKAALNLFDEFEKGLTNNDKDLADKAGYNIYGLMAGAWAGGNGNLRKYLEGRGDTSDSHHYEKAGKGKGLGTTVGTYVNLFTESTKQA